MSMARTVDTQDNGVISRRLTQHTFETDDPSQCADWLRAIGYTDIRTHGPREHARLQLGPSTTVVYTSGLVITLPGDRL